MYKQVMDLLIPRPMVPVSIAFILGILLQLYLDLGISFLLAMITVLSLARLLSGRCRQCLIILIILVSGSLRLSFYNFLPENSLNGFPVERDSIYHVSGTIESFGETRRGTPKFIVEPYQIDSIPITQGKLILYAKDIRESLGLGDTIQTEMRLNQPRGKRNPHDFDYRKYLKSQDIHFESFLMDSAEVFIAKSTSFMLERSMLDIKGNVKSHFQKYLSKRSAGILSALILGERGDVDQQIREDFSNTGVIHVLAVSGLHVGYVSMILITVLGMLRLPYKYMMVTVIGGLIFYVGLTGSAPSVMRASIMASLLILGGLLERKTDVFNVLAAAGLLILLINPTQLFNIGFQLSFSAVLSIVTLFPFFQVITNKYIKLPKSKFGNALSGILDLFLVSLAAQLGTLAITIFYFHKIPLISLIANLIVVPVIGLIVATGMSYLLIGVFVPPLGRAWAATIDGSIDLMLWFVAECAQFNWAYLSTRQITSMEVLLIILAIFGVLVFKRHSLPWFWMTLLLIWGNYTIWSDIRRPQYLELAILDVGQGDAIVIHSAPDRTMIIDTGLRFGGKDIGKDVLVPYLQTMNYGKVDLLVLTHPHNDHIGGAQSLIENIQVDKILMPDVEYESYGYQVLLKTIDSLDISRRTLFTGEIDSSLKPIYLRVLGPRSYDKPSQPSNINNTSIVLQLFYGESTILLTGDAEVEMEVEQKPFGPLLHSDIIKAPHHGSKTSSSQQYLHEVDPDIALISLGDKNKFRHPSPITMKRYKARNVDIFRTDLEGALLYRSDGVRWSKVNWENENH